MTLFRINNAFEVDYLPYNSPIDSISFFKANELLNFQKIEAKSTQFFLAAEAFPAYIHPIIFHV